MDLDAGTFIGMMRSAAAGEGVFKDGFDRAVQAYPSACLSLHIQPTDSVCDVRIKFALQMLGLIQKIPNDVSRLVVVMTLNLTSREKKMASMKGRQREVAEVLGCSVRTVERRFEYLVKNEILRNVSSGLARPLAEDVVERAAKDFENHGRFSRLAAFNIDELLGRYFSRTDEQTRKAPDRVPRQASQICPDPHLSQPGFDVQQHHHVRQEGGWTIATLHGAVDMISARTIRSALERLTSQGVGRRLVICIADDFSFESSQSNARYLLAACLAGLQPGDTLRFVVDSVTFWRQVEKDELLTYFSRYETVDLATRTEISLPESLRHEDFFRLRGVS